MAKIIQGPSQIERSIQLAVRQEIGRIIEEEVATAQANVQRRIRETADKLALSIMSNYRVYEQDMKIIIEVNKKPEGV